MIAGARCAMNNDRALKTEAEYLIDTFRGLSLNKCGGWFTVSQLLFTELSPHPFTVLN